MDLTCVAGNDKNGQIGDTDMGATASSAEQPVDLSIVICTRNRAVQLAAALASLEKLRTTAKWEAVLVDNGSTDATAEVIQAAAARLPSIRYTFEAQRGLGAARDHGWRQARGRIVAFTDDDCYVTPEFVDAVLQVFGENPDIGFAGGRILLFDPDDAPITIDLREVGEMIPACAYVHTGALQGANLMFRRNTLEVIGGFDRGLGAGTLFPCEDIDVIAAAVWAGFPGCFDPRPKIYHHHRRREADLAAINNAYDQGRGAYFAKYIIRSDTRYAYMRAWRKWIATSRGAFARRAVREMRSAASYAWTNRKNDFRTALVLAFCCGVMALALSLHISMRRL